MLITSAQFDIDQIAESGQCFRMTKVSDGVYGLIFRGRYIELAKRGTDADGSSIVELSCSREEFDAVWKDYFDFQTDYSDILGMVDKNDAFLSGAAEYGQGIRILRQDPWEMLISFIISQRKSIPAIRTSIERLAARCGDKIDTPVGTAYSFPTAEQILGLSPHALDECGLGYRSKYIADISRRAAEGEVDVYSMYGLPDEELKKNLLNLYGVGNKVAACVMLFGYHRIESFPEDVWIKRALESHYPDGFPYEKYPGCAGVMQQYIFFYIRNNRL